MIIGRKKEIEALMDAAASRESELIAVYGRRRVGKTYLIKSLFDGKFTFCHTGLADADKQTQISRFCKSMQNQGIEVDRIPNNWYSAFDILRDTLTKMPDGKKIIFIDEMPWMDTHKSNFISAFENFWNDWASMRNDILLIICGSATSWIVKKILKSKGGLHNRVTKRISLKPFTLKECEEYAIYRNLGMERIQIAEAYMILGGIPFYWKQLTPGLSLTQNIDNLFFSDDASLRGEFNELFKSLFKNPAIYINIVEQLCKKGIGVERKVLLQELKADDNKTFQEALSDLTECGFIRQYNIIGNKSKNALYQIVDPFILFHYRFINGNLSNDEHFWANSIDSQSHIVWRGLSFEKLCMAHASQIKSALGISGILSNIYSWTFKGNDEMSGAQIDMLIDRNDGIIDLCEVKFSNKPYTITKEYAFELQTKADTFKAVTKTRKAVHIVFISTYGLSHNAYWQCVNKELMLDALFS